MNRNGAKSQVTTMNHMEKDMKMYAIAPRYDCPKISNTISRIISSMPLTKWLRE